MGTPIPDRVLLDDLARREEALAKELGLVREMAALLRMRLGDTPAREDGERPAQPPTPAPAPVPGPTNGGPSKKALVLVHMLEHDGTALYYRDIAAATNVPLDAVAGVLSRGASKDEGLCLAAEGAKRGSWVLTDKGREYATKAKKALAAG